MTGLAAEWESSEAVREQLRGHRLLCARPAGQLWCEPNRPNCVSNSSVLIPALQHLREDPKWTLPYLEPLQVEISMIYGKLGVPVTPKQVYTSAVEVKKMLGFVKRRANRHEVTKALWF